MALRSSTDVPLLRILFLAQHAVCAPPYTWHSPSPKNRQESGVIRRNAPEMDPIEAIIDRADRAMGTLIHAQGEFPASRLPRPALPLQALGAGTYP